MCFVNLISSCTHRYQNHCDYKLETLSKFLDTDDKLCGFEIAELLKIVQLSYAKRERKSHLTSKACIYLKIGITLSCLVRGG